MKITNRLGLPESFINYEKRNKYTMGDADYSATTLIDSPRIGQMRSWYRERITEDISDMVMSLLGTAVHSILEQGAGPNDVVEKRFFAEFGGKTITGQADLMSPNPDGSKRGYIISDYKTTSAYAISKEPEGKEAWHQQLNIYAALARKSGFKVTGLEVVAVIRDWSKRSAERSSSYPKSAVVRIPIKIWDEEDAIQFIESRVVAHEKSKNILPDCSEEERWVSPTVWAVHRRNGGKVNKRASKLLDSEEDANQLAKESSAIAERKGGRETSDYVVIKRVGESIRCKSFCSVSQWCSQWEQIQKENEDER
jgi:hypothetical protein